MDIRILYEVVSKIRAHEMSLYGEIGDSSINTNLAFKLGASKNTKYQEGEDRPRMTQVKKE